MRELFNDASFHCRLYSIERWKDVERSGRYTDFVVMSQHAFGGTETKTILSLYKGSPDCVRGRSANNSTVVFTDMCGRNELCRTGGRKHYGKGPFVRCRYDMESSY